MAAGSTTNQSRPDSRRPEAVGGARVRPARSNRQTLPFFTVLLESAFCPVKYMYKKLYCNKIIPLCFAFVRVSAERAWTRVPPHTTASARTRRARAERDDDDDDDDDDDGDDSEDSKPRRGTPRESRDDEVDDASRGWTRKIYDDGVSTDGVEGARRGGVRG